MNVCLPLSWARNAALSVLPRSATQPSLLSGTIKSASLASLRIGHLKSKLTGGIFSTFSFWMLKPTPAPSIRRSIAQVNGSTGLLITVKAQFWRLARPSLLTVSVPSCQRNRPATVPFSSRRYLRRRSFSASVKPTPSCSLEALTIRLTVSVNSSVGLLIFCSSKRRA